MPRSVPLRPAANLTSSTCRFPHNERVEYRRALRMLISIGTGEGQSSLQTKAWRGDQFSRETRMELKSCICCGQLFETRPQTPHQAYCSSPTCQRARKRLWQREKLKSDSDYRDNQRDAQRAWQKRHPDYWRQYRNAHPDYVVRSRSRQRGQSHSSFIDLAKMDVSPIVTGLYWIRLADAPGHAAQPFRLVTIEPACVDCPCKTDACKERT